MSYVDRILNDGLDRESWEWARRSIIGGSDAASLSKLESVNKYLRAKVGTHWDGNEYSRRGHRWERMMLAWAGIPQNVALIHAPDEPGFAATPDGILERGAGEVLLAECKLKHHPIKGPDLSEWRQLAWQFRVLPEATETLFIWQELDDDRNPVTDEPNIIRIYRGDPKILDLQTRMEPIARVLLPMLRAARQAEELIGL